MTATSPTSSNSPPIPNAIALGAYPVVDFVSKTKKTVLSVKTFDTNGDVKPFVYRMKKHVDAWDESADPLIRYAENRVLDIHVPKGVRSSEFENAIKELVAHVRKTDRVVDLQIEAKEF